jgi:hypothetical protein
VTVISDQAKEPMEVTISGFGASKVLDRYTVANLASKNQRQMPSTSRAIAWLRPVDEYVNAQTVRNAEAHGTTQNKHPAKVAMDVRIEKFDAESTSANSGNTKGSGPCSVLLEHVSTRSELLEP